MRFLPCGDDAVLVELAGLDEALALARALTTRPVAGVVDVVTGARTVLLQLSPAADRARVRREVAERTGDEAAPDEAETVEVRVVYDGEDIAEVAERTGLTPDEVVARHAEATYEVAFTGFAPGFAYLSGLDPALHLPRRATPRPSIPAGAVAIAGEFAGVYPTASPGGWHLLGRALDEMWNLERTPPALLRPGMRVRFVPVGTGEDRASSSSAQGRKADRDFPGEAAASALEIVEPSPHALIEDEGRPGRAALGVAPSGAMDRGALHRANRLVGNPPAAAAIETALGGLRLRARGPQTVAVTGAPAPLTIIRAPRAAPDLRFRSRADPPAVAAVVTALSGADHAPRATERGDDDGLPAAERSGESAPPAAAATGGADDADRTDEAPERRGPVGGEPDAAPEHPALFDAPHPAAPVIETAAAFDAPFALAAGDELIVGAAARGVYSYVAVRGGIDVEPVLGSASRDALAGLGPAPLAPGALLPVAAGAVAAVEPSLGPPEPLPSAGDLIRIDVVPGPRDDWFAPGALAALADQEWRVSPRSNRVGLRLEGERALVRARADELPSEGTVTGALQVPPDGRPILFAADRPLTGGYPVIAVVTRRHLALAAQAPPGCRIAFRVV